jgi:hypothetical protein
MSYLALNEEIVVAEIIYSSEPRGARQNLVVKVQLLRGKQCPVRIIITLTPRIHKSLLHEPRIMSVTPYLNLFSRIRE